MSEGLVARAGGGGTPPPFGFAQGKRSATTALRFGNGRVRNENRTHNTVAELRKSKGKVRRGAASALVNQAGSMALTRMTPVFISRTPITFTFLFTNSRAFCWSSSW